MQFTKEQFIDVFIKYNTAVFPVQILFYILGLLAVYISFKNYANRDIIISMILAVLWLWIGIVYNLIFFSAINKAAYLFGPLFIIQSVVFFYYGVIKTKMRFRYSGHIYSITGAVLLSYGLLFYPLAGLVLGHVYPAQPTFGLPCPTTIFTFGILLWSKDKLPLYFLIIPVVWTLIGFFAALNFGIYEDIGLLLSGAAGFYLIFRKNREIISAQPA